MSQLMDCARARRWSARGEDPAASDALRQAVERHLAGCAACRRFVEEMRQLDRAMAGLPVEMAPAGFVQTVMARLPQAQPQRDWVALWASALATALVAAVAVGYWGGDWVQGQVAGALTYWEGWTASWASIRLFFSPYGLLARWGIALALLGIAAWLVGLAMLWLGLDDPMEGDVRHA